MAFRIVGLDVAPFRPLFGLPEAELSSRGARRVVADDSKPGYPCRVSLEEAKPGEPLLLLNFEHQAASTPYRSCHAIFVRESARQTFDRLDDVPEMMRTRLLSIRAFDDNGMIVDADVIDGMDAETLIDRLFSSSDAAYLHVHFAKRGCYAARIERP
jgi:hypothetical protein